MRQFEGRRGGWAVSGELKKPTENAGPGFPRPWEPAISKPSYGEVSRPRHFFGSRPARSGNRASTPTGLSAQSKTVWARSFIVPTIRPLGSVPVRMAGAVGTLKDGAHPTRLPQRIYPCRVIKRTTLPAKSFPRDRRFVSSSVRGCRRCR